MLLSTNVSKPRTARVDRNQVCARGWQDYMLETQYFLSESRVAACLEDMTGSQLEKLGLSSAEIRKARAR